MKKNSFTRKELYDLVWSKPLTSIAEEFSISNVGLRKICWKMDIPLPEMGFWMKRKFNKKITRKILPENFDVLQSIALKQRAIDKNITPHLNKHLISREKELIDALGASLIIPKRLSDPCQHVRDAAMSLKSKKHRAYQYEGVYTTSRDEIDISVSFPNFSRSLRLMDSIIKTLIRRDHGFTIDNGKSYAIIYGQEIQIRIREIAKRVQNKDSYGFFLLPTGNLKIQFDDYFKKQIVDGKVSLEERFPRLIACLELLGEKKKQERIELEAYWAEQKEKDRIRKELKEKKDLELENFRSLYHLAMRYQKAQYIRNYLNSYESYLVSHGKLTSDKKHWLDWAIKKTDWLDPFINLQDDLLADVNKDEVFVKLKKQYYFGY